MDKGFWCPRCPGVCRTWHPLTPDPNPSPSSGIVTQPRISRFPSCTAKPALLMFCLSSGGRLGAPGNQKKIKGKERTTCGAGREGVRLHGTGGIPGAGGTGVGGTGEGIRSGLQHQVSYPKILPEGSRAPWMIIRCCWELSWAPQARRRRKNRAFPSLLSSQVVLQSSLGLRGWGTGPPANLD